MYDFTTCVVNECIVISAQVSNNDVQILQYCKMSLDVVKKYCDANEISSSSMVVFAAVQVFYCCLAVTVRSF